MRIGLAVSGGADSTALLVLMDELAAAHGFEPCVLHVDHGLRPGSGADAAFVRELASAHGLEFHELRAHVRRRRGESVEMAARRVRLGWFSRMTRELGLDAIATGHQADDVAETFVLRMKRASGAAGLAGLKPVSRVGSVTFIRPLLGVRHRDLCEFLRRRDVAWREDPTNADLSIPRNRVRHVVLPFLAREFDPKIVEHVCRSAEILRGDADGGDGGRRGATRPADGGDAAVGTSRPACQPAGGGSGRYVLTVAPDSGFAREGGTPGELPARAWLSRTALAGRSLELRPWRAGDRIAPTGMGGRSRKLQDVYVTAKTPPEVRRSLPVLADARTGEILWVPGYRVAECVKAESDDAPTWRMELGGESLELGAES